MNTDKLGYYEDLAPEIITLEQLERLYRIAESRNYGNDKNIYLGNLVACLPEWKEQSQQSPEQQEGDYIEGPMPMDTYKLAGRLCLKYQVKLDTSDYVTEELDSIYKQVRSKSRFEILLREAGQASLLEGFLERLKDGRVECRSQGIKQ